MLKHRFSNDHHICTSFWAAHSTASRKHLRGQSPCENWSDRVYFQPQLWEFPDWKINNYAEKCRYLNLNKSNFPSKYLKIRTLLANLIDTLFDTLKTGFRCRSVNQYEGMCIRYRKSSHCRKLHVAGRVQDVNL